MLLVDPGHSVSIDRMVTEVWGDAPSTRAVASLYTHISNLRRVLGKDRIQRDTAGYRLVLGVGDEVDGQMFEVRAEDARRRAFVDPTAAIDQFDIALGLWRGRPFEGLEDLRVVEPEIVRLTELQADVEFERLEARFAAGGTPSVSEAEDLCHRRPLDEHAWELLMRTLYRSGRQADALRTYQEVRTLFGQEMGIEPSLRLIRLEEQILLHDPALDLPDRRRIVNLPTYLTSFVGREDDRARLIDAVKGHRLVTVTGPGGIGKTRLVVDVAVSLRDRFPDGIWFVDLARINEGRGVLPAIGAAVGAVGGADVSASAVLAGRRGLLILDNCEHVVGAARDVTTTLLEATDDLVVLTTSRVVLQIPGEFRIGLEGLAITGEGDRPGAAAELFRDRASSIRPMQAVADGNGEAIDAICRRLDGVPLALELAAARSDVLGPSEIADLLARRFAVLVDASQDREIHRSLEATVGWSYGLLPSDDREGFAALGIFEGPFTTDAACAVLNMDETASICLIGRLVSASLVEVEVAGVDGSTTYRLLDSLRLYARDRLVESCRWDAIARQHDDHYAAICRDVANELLVRGRPDALRAIALSSDEMISAWDRMLAGDPEAVLPIAWALGNHWLMSGGIVEGESRIRDLLLRTSEVATWWRMLGLTVGSWVADRRGSVTEALRWSGEAVLFADTSGDRRALVVALNHAGQLRVDCGDQAGAMELLERSVDLLTHLESDFGSNPEILDGKAWGMVGLGEARRWAGEPAPAVVELLYGVRRHFIETGDLEGQIRADRVLVTMTALDLDERGRLSDEMGDLAKRTDFGNLRYEAAKATAIVSWDTGDRDRAVVANRAALRVAVAGGSLHDVGSALLYAGTFAAHSGHPERAARLIGAGSPARGFGPGPHTPLGIEAAIDRIRTDLGDDRCEELQTVGAMLALGEAQALVLG